MSSYKARMFLYKILISHHAPADKEFVIYRSSERRMSKEKLTKITEELLHSSKSGYKVKKIMEIKLTP